MDVAPKIQKVFFIGLTCVDYIAEVNQLPKEDTEVRSNGFRQTVGGNAANSARVAAALGQKVTLLTPLTKLELNDPSSLFAESQLKVDGVKIIKDNIEAPIPTSFITASKSTGSRTIVSCKDSRYRNVSADTFQYTLHQGKIIDDATDRIWVHFEGRDGREIHKCITIINSWRTQNKKFLHQNSSTIKHNSCYKNKRDIAKDYSDIGQNKASEDYFITVYNTLIVSLELEKPSEGRGSSLVELIPEVDVVFLSSVFAKFLGLYFCKTQSF